MLYLIEILHQTTTKLIQRIFLLWLYLIEILHQTTTVIPSGIDFHMLYLIEILHQTTTANGNVLSKKGCILLKFYIKPQQLGYSFKHALVVSY